MSKKDSFDDLVEDLARDITQRIGVEVTKDQLISWTQEAMEEANGDEEAALMIVLGLIDDLDEAENDRNTETKSAAERN